MICSPKLTFKLVVLAASLGLGSCVGEDNSAAQDAIVPVNPTVLRLLAEADAAIVGGALAHAGGKLDEARALSPDDPDLWVAIARLRFRGGEHLTALEAADRALQTSPRHAPALLLRALMVRDAHSPAEALAWFEAALAADPQNADVWAEYAATLGDSGRSRAMLRAVRKLAEIASDDERVFYLQAVLAARGGNPALARSLLVRSRMAARGVPAAMVLDAVLSLDQRNFDSAAATLELLAARQPANVRVRELLARALLLGEREAELVERFGAEAERAEASPHLLMIVARAHERLGDRKRAAPLLTRAYAGAMKTPFVMVDRAGLPQPTTDMRLAASQGNWVGTRLRAEDLRARFPASADVASLAGDAALGAGETGGALTAYALASKVRRPWPLTRKIVFASYRAGDSAAADTLLARHVKGEPLALSGLVCLAEAQAARGDWRRTALLLDHAIALGGGHDHAVLSLRIRAARELGEPEQVRGFSMLLREIRPRPLMQR